jgi:hypothetical protein
LGWETGKSSLPLLKLMGTATDDASDVSANKYRYIALAAEGKR